MGKICLTTAIFIFGFLILNFMPVDGDSDTVSTNNIYMKPYKGLENRRIIETVVYDDEKSNSISNNADTSNKYNAANGDLVCSFDSSIDSDIREYNELMIEYALRYAAAANKAYNPPSDITGMALLAFAKQEKTPDPNYAVIWQGYWNTLKQMKSKWMDIRYTDVNIYDAITGNTDGPLQLTINYGRNNPAIQNELGIIGTTPENPRKERLNNSLYGDRFNALDSMNMTAGELAKVMASMPEGECRQIFSKLNSYGVIMLIAYAHNYGQGVFTHSDTKASIAAYADFSKLSLYKFAKSVSENVEIRKIIEDEILKQGVNFAVYWNGEVSEKIFRYYSENPVEDQKMDDWIKKTYNAVRTKTQWYAGGISCAHRLFYGINAYANALWLKKYAGGELTM